MTNQSPESVIAEVIEYHADAIGSHYDGCHKHHAPCLAVKLRDMLREPGVPDAATEELARIKPLFENYSREYPNECNKRVKAEAERDAALAAVERVRDLANSLRGRYADNSDAAYFTKQFLAALDGAPEPEPVKTLFYAPNVRNGGHTGRPDGFTEKQWHQDATADTGVSHTLPGRLYIVQCEWCPKAFAAQSKAGAMAMFRRHEDEMSGRLPVEGESK